MTCPPSLPNLCKLKDGIEFFRIDDQKTGDKLQSLGRLGIDYDPDSILVPYGLYLKNYTVVDKHIVTIAHSKNGNNFLLIYGGAETPAPTQTFSYKRATLSGENLRAFKTSQISIGNITLGTDKTN